MYEINIRNPVEWSEGLELRCARVRRSEPGEKKKITISQSKHKHRTRTHTLHTPARSQALYMVYRWCVTTVVRRARWLGTATMRVEVPVCTMVHWQTKRSEHRLPRRRHKGRTPLARSRGRPQQVPHARIHTHTHALARAFTCRVHTHTRLHVAPLPPHTIDNASGLWGRGDTVSAAGDDDDDDNDDDFIAARVF